MGGQKYFCRNVQDVKSNYESFSSALEAKSVAESWQPAAEGGRKGKMQKEDEAQKKKQGQSEHPCSQGNFQKRWLRLKC